MRPSTLIKQWIELVHAQEHHRLKALYLHEVDINHMLPEKTFQLNDSETSETNETKNNMIDSLIEHKNWAILRWRSSEGWAQWIVFCILNGKIVFQRNYVGDATQIFS